MQPARHHLAGPGAHVADRPGRVRQVLGLRHGRTPDRSAGPRLPGPAHDAGLPAPAVRHRSRPGEPVPDHRVPSPAVPRADAAALDRTRPAPVRLPHPSGRIGQPSPARTGLAVPVQRQPARPATADDAKPSHAARTDRNTTVRSEDKYLFIPNGPWYTP